MAGAFTLRWILRYAKVKASQLHRGSNSLCTARCLAALICRGLFLETFTASGLQGLFFSGSEWCASS